MDRRTAESPRPGTGSGRCPRWRGLPPVHRYRTATPPGTRAYPVGCTVDSPRTGSRRHPTRRHLPPLHRYRAVTTPPGTRAYPVGRAVNVPRPWVRLRNLVA